MFRTIREIWANLSPKDKRYLSLCLWIMSVMGMLAVFILPRLFTMPAPYKWMAFPDSSGNVSTTINGISTPFIALASAFLTFLAFWVQYQSNIQQKLIFDAELKRKSKEDSEREKIWRIERFEDRFYELLKLHKSNVDEMRIGKNIAGRKCFMTMFYEFRFIYNYAESLLKERPELYPAGKSDFDLLSFTYKIFFYGIGPNAERHFVHNLHEEEKKLYLVIKNHLHELQTRFLINRKDLPDTDHHYTLHHDGAEDAISLNYCPFDGYIDRVAHYLRHLFQVGKYVIGQDFIDDEEKYNYIKILRAQLSNYEQLMLYYNSLAWFRDGWRPLFVKYRLIKNLPLPLADFAIRPKEYFKDDIEKLWEEKKVHMFEWDE